MVSGRRRGKRVADASTQTPPVEKMPRMDGCMPQPEDYMLRRHWHRLRGGGGRRRQLNALLRLMRVLRSDRWHLVGLVALYSGQALSVLRRWGNNGGRVVPCELAQEVHGAHAGFSRAVRALYLAGSTGGSVLDEMRVVEAAMDRLGAALCALVGRRYQPTSKESERYCVGRVQAVLERLFAEDRRREAARSAFGPALARVAGGARPPVAVAAVGAAAVVGAVCPLPGYAAGAAAAAGAGVVRRKVVRCRRRASGALVVGHAAPAAPQA